MENNETALDILNESVHTLNDIKISKKALKDVISNISDNSGVDTSFIKGSTKIVSKMGLGCTNKEKPLSIDKEAKDKDPLAVLLNRFVETVEYLRNSKISYKLKPYFEQLESDFGIKIMLIDNSENETPDEELNELYNSSTAYLRTIKEYQDEIREDHSQKAEDKNFVKSKDYNKVLNIYNKGLDKGVEAIEDRTQDILADCEQSKNDLDTLETAINFVHDNISNNL